MGEHVPYDFDAHSEDVEAKDVRTLVRWFCEPGRAHLYEPGAFVYAWGSFFYTSDDELEVIIHAHAVDR